MSMLLPSLLLIYSFIALLFSFNNRFTRSQYVSVIAFTLTIFTGGIGAFSLFIDPNVNSLDDALNTIVNSDYTQWYYWFEGGRRAEMELFWFSLVAHVLYPQRSSLFVYPLILSVFIFLFVAHKNSTKLSNRDKNLLFLISGVLSGLLPMIQGHAFIGMCFFAAMIALTSGLTSVLQFQVTGLFTYPIQLRNFSFGVKFNLFKFKSYVRNWLFFGIPLLILAIPQLLLFVGRVSSSDEFFVFKSVWAGRNTDFFTLWFEALGLFVFLSFLGVEFLNANQMRFYVAAVGVFFLCNLCIFTPWDKDNIKTFYLWVFVASGVIAKVLVKLCTAEVPPKDPKIITLKSKSQPQPKRRSIAFFSIALAIYLSLIFTGVTGVYRESQHKYSFLDKEDVELAYWIRDNTPHDSYFAISDHHINPATTFAGRSTIIGYSGWASSHGYPWYPRFLDRNLLFQQSSNEDQILGIVKKLKIGYVLFDPRVRGEFSSAPETHPFWSKKALLVKKTGRYALYDVRKFLNE